MGHYLIIPVMCLLCLSAADGEGVSGPEILVTNRNWTRELTLRCQAPAGMDVDRYEWFTPGAGDQTKRCGTTEDVCTFEPRLEDDNQKVTCNALGPTGQTLNSAFYAVNLTYPPSDPPCLSYTGKLTQGGIITCTVSGGKPPVTNVTFHCQHPDLADREDVISKDGRNVSSPIMVNDSEATNVTVNCTCSAYWAPEPGLYSHILNRTDPFKWLDENQVCTNNDCCVSALCDTDNKCNLPEGNKQPQSIASGAGVGAMAFVAFIVITCVT